MVDERRNVLRCPQCGARRTASGRCPWHGAIGEPARATGAYGRSPTLTGFTLERKIGAGGHGTVWSGRRNTDRRPTCLKVAHFSDAASLARWNHEIACQQRAGPMIAADVLGSGTLRDGTHWLAMTRVQGETLAATMAARPTPWTCEAVAGALTPVLASAKALHERGVVHGDLKPENIIISLGRAVLLDFGSACSTDDDSSAGPGTAEYLAPERCITPPRCSAASDVYALAVIAYELLTGAPPFFGPDELVLEAHRTLRPMAVANRGLPRGLDTVLRDALAKDPRQRTPSVEAFARALLPVLAAHGEARAVRVSSVERETGGSSRTRMALLWVCCNATPSRIEAPVERHGGSLVHARGGRYVAAFPTLEGAMSLANALATASALLADGDCERVLVDVDEVAVHGSGTTARVFSPRFGFATRYPADDDPSGLAFTMAAVEIGAGRPLSPMDHRADRFVPVEADVPAMRELPLLGRDALLHALHDAMTDVEDGRPTLVTIEGEPGSGRTRIATAAHVRFQSDAFVRVVHVRVPETGSHGGLPLLLDALLALPTEGSPRLRLAHALGCTPSKVPKGLLLALDAAEPDDPEVAAMRAAPGAIRICIAAAIADVIARAAASRPLAIMIDDVDRADAALLDAIEAATLAEGSLPVLAVVLAREGFARDRPDWGRRAARSIVLELPPLDLDATAELVRAGLEPASNVPDIAVAEIHRRTRGLPLLLVEMLHTLRNGGALRRIPDTTGWMFATDVLQHVPDMPLAAWMAGRELDRLPRTLARHASVVAAMGPDTEPAALEAVLRRLEEDDAALPSELDAAVAAERLVAAGILRRASHGIAFRHEALREHAAARLDADARRRLHRAALLCATKLAARLHHAIGADAPEEVTRCALALGQDAARDHAYLEAERCYGLAYTTATSSSHDAITARHGRGLMRFRLGRYADAREDLEVVAAELGSTSLRLDALLDAATVEDWCEDFERAEAFVRDAEQTAGDRSHVQRARLALARGRVAFRLGNIEDAVADLTHAVEAAREIGDDAYETRVIALLLLAPLLGMTGSVDRSLPMFDELFALCESHSDRIHLATALLNRPFVWMELGRHDELHADLERVIALSRSAGFPLLESRARHNLGELAYLVGDTSTALRHVEAVIDLETRLGGKDRLAATHLLEARCRLFAGEREHARRIVEGMRERGVALMPSDDVLCRMVELACADADGEAWSDLVARSAADSVQQEHIEVLQIAASAAAGRAEHERARTWIERALEVAGTIPTVMRARVEQVAAALPVLRAAG